MALGTCPKDFFPFSAPEFLRSAMITSMVGQGKCSQASRVYTVNQPNRRKMFLFVFVSFVPSKDSTILQQRPTPTDTVIMLKNKHSRLERIYTRFFDLMESFLNLFNVLLIVNRIIFRNRIRKYFKSLKQLFFFSGGLFRLKDDINNLMEFAKKKKTVGGLSGFFPHPRI